jgi:xanthine/uracil permease
VNPRRIVGAVVLVVGVTLLSVGINAPHSLADQVTNTFVGQATTWYIFGSSASVLLGVLLVLFNLRR